MTHSVELTKEEQAWSDRNFQSDFGARIRNGLVTNEEIAALLSSLPLVFDRGEQVGPFVDEMPRPGVTERREAWFQTIT